MVDMRGVKCEGIDESTKASRSELTGGLICPTCDGDGKYLEFDPHGTWERNCNWCKGTGKLNATQAKNLLRARELYKQQRAS